MTAKRITLATIKSFIKKSPERSELYIRCESSFDPMEDGVRPNEDTGFRIALRTDDHLAYSLGIKGAWFVGGSRNWFTAFDNGQYRGYEVSNCCGTFILAVKS